MQLLSSGGLIRAGWAKMSSHTHPAVSSLKAGMPRFSMWPLQQAKLRLTHSLVSVPTTTSRTGVLQASACITFANGPSAKISHIAKLGFKGKRENLFLMGRAVK